MKSFSKVFLLFLKQLLFGTNNPGPICQGVKDTVFCLKVVVDDPLEVEVSMGWFPIHRG